MRNKPTHYTLEDIGKDLVTRAFPAARTDFQSSVKWLIVGTMAIASIVLLGWLLEVETMKRIATGLTSMNPVTATCFLAASLCLWLLRVERPAGFGGLVVLVLPLFLLGVGLSKIFDVAMGTSICPDDLLFKAQLDYGQAYPSRMAPNVALCFSLLAIALFGVDRPRWPAWLHPQWLAAPILALAFSALIGYCYNTSGFYKYKQYIPMALHSAVCFLLLGAALILSRPRQGYLQHLPKGSPGARAYARILPACVLIPSMFGALSLVGGERGWFEGKGASIAAVAVLTILVLAALSFANSVAVNRAESIRKISDLQLRNMLAELDQRNEALRHEVEERKRMEELAKKQASHDPLTGLPNRLLFSEHLAKAVGRSARTGQKFSLFYIDIDKFKPINDRYGHAAGDLVLKQIAARLLGTMREVDTVARLGGDEFAALMDSPVNTLHATALAERIGAAVRKPIAISVAAERGLVEVTVGVSIGVALHPDHADDLQGLIHVADQAMYEAKRSGKEKKSLVNIALARREESVDDSPKTARRFSI